jgi:predicted deacylase
LVVHYRTTSEWRPATAMDLSVIGCRLRLGEDLERGSQVTVRFESPEGVSKVAADVPGVVIWSRLEGLSYQAGLKFSEASEGLHELLSALG